MPQRLPLKALVAIGKHGKWVLPIGLLAAVLLPQIAMPMQALIGPLLAALLVVSFLQINPSAQPQWRLTIKHSLLLLLCMQLILPIVLLLAMQAASVPVAWLVPITLVAAASCIAGGPSIAMMLGGDGAAAVRLLIVSTLLLPVTAIPILALLPLHSSHGMLVRTALVLALVVFGAYFLARVLREHVFGPYNQQQRACLDGLAAVLLALLVLGLMAAIHTAWDNPGLLLTTLLCAFVVNFVFQLFGLGLNSLFSMNLPIVIGVMSGNRAVAIFLTALPESSYQPYLLFIACYQIPMYLTPLLGNYVYRRYKENAS